MEFALAEDLSAVAGAATLEPLEPRRHLAASAWADGDTLHVLGTEWADHLRVSASPSGLRVESDSAMLGEFAGIGRVVVQGLGGDDTLIASADVRVPVELYGGDGNDTLVAQGPQAVLHGGSGTNAYWAGRKTRLTVHDDTRPTRQLRINRLPEVFSRVSVAPAASSARSVGGSAVGSSAAVSADTATTPASAALAVRATLREPRPTGVASGTADFTGRPLFATDGPSADDVRQGRLNNCFFLVTLAGVAAADPGLIRSVITDLGDGTYAVRLMRGRTAAFYRVDADLPVVLAELPAYAGLGREDSLWVALVEKAFALDRGGTYARLDRGGWMGDALRSLGVSAQTVGLGRVGGVAGLVSWVSRMLADGHIVTLGTRPRLSELGLVPNHAYQVEGVVLDDSGRAVGLLVRNPWGWDGPAGDGRHTVDARVVLRAVSAFAVGRIPPGGI
ncbi:MAG: C2 family cysteine protease [Tepidisphaerales bacterium]